VFGDYARILVDIEFSCHVFNEIMEEQDIYDFKVEVSYEWLPYFCSYCQIIGHDLTTCRWLIPKKVVEEIDRGKKIGSFPIESY